MKNNFKKSLWAFVNSAFGIWLLSTIVVGSLSFGYTVWKERQDLDIKNNLELQAVLEEGRFRMANLDESMGNASLSMSPLFGLIDKNKKIETSRFNKGLENLFVLTATIRLGGLTYLPPLQEKENYRVLDRVYSLKDTPFSQGSKFPKYQNYSLLDLARLTYQLQNNVDMPKDTYSSLKSDLEELLYLSDLTFKEREIEDLLKKSHQLSDKQLKETFLSVTSIYVRIKEHLDDNIRYRKELVFFDNHGT